MIIDAWKGDAAPTIMLNMSNLAWFQDSLALPQHLQISRMRVLETQHPMLRATNTGATAIIDARGRVTGALPFLTAGALTGQVQGMRGHDAVHPLGQRPGGGPGGGCCSPCSAALRGPAAVGASRLSGT